MIVCPQCGERVFRLYNHHTARKVNNRTKTTKLCFKCHCFVHDNPRAARELGLYDEIDGIYRPKRKNPKKWILKKGVV
jgi:hypothetical protein